ncbi:GIY-YIG nuclease family protein [Leptospira yanagawae]|uniref:GIY-YIG nuclease family protein n=1 Tax=Leptospira yanagawae TaxID=293069 RepID=UPI001FD11B73
MVRKIPPIAFRYGLWPTQGSAFLLHCCRFGRLSSEAYRNDANANHLGYNYILICSDGSYYTGSTKYLNKRLNQHQRGEGANYTKKRLPVKLINFGVYSQIDFAFYLEKQGRVGLERKKNRWW